MTRINTNISSLNAQKSLARSNASLQESLTRLSTGLRINVGKDDPAGLIASEVLRSDITSVETAIANTERANQVIATADSALGQISSLLNDIRGLVTEAANQGALSDEQIAANQLQVDSSLEAINRIAQTTSFQGRKLLDGGFDFLTTTASTDNFEDVTNLQIDQATIDSDGIDVEIDITSAATQAAITTTIIESDAAVAASATITFDENSDTLAITAATAGAAGNDITFEIIETDQVVAGEVLAWYDEANNKIEVRVNNLDTDIAMTDIEAAVDGLAVVSATYTGAGDSEYDATANDPANFTAQLTNGSDAVSGITGDLVVEISGNNGSEVFSFENNASGAEIVAAINLVSDATGVTASFTPDTLTITSAGYGDDAFVRVNVVSDDGTFESNLSATRDTGDDIVATVNGITAGGDGNTLSINTATLDMNATIAAGQTDTIKFTITGGGAMFQLGPDVVSNQQARIGIASVNTANLRGDAGRLFEIGDGQSASLANDATTAATIVDQVIAKVASLRGRLGAFQKTTLDANIASLTDTMENLSAAESTIRDADFAAESAALTRAQILVQSGTSVLSIANSNPQNVLALLR